MNKKDFDKLVDEASKEFEEEKKERAKEIIKEMLKEYELAKATASRIEKQLKQLKEQGAESPLLIGYDQ